MQVDPMKPTLKPPGTKRLKLKCDIMLSNSAFKFNLRRHSTARAGDAHDNFSLNSPRRGGGGGGRGSHSSTFRLNISAFCGIGGAFRGC